MAKKRETTQFYLIYVNRDRRKRERKTEIIIINTSNYKLTIYHINP